ncbi:MAG: hypothetical protein HQ512_14850 [Rhodospirillales bacterium]|nr:hypothetical protein [Rhodospirillales bacterium]
MRRRKPQPLLFLGFVIIMGALMYAKDLPTVPDSSVGLRAAVGRLKVYYQEYPPQNNWQIAEIASRDGEVWVDVIAHDAKTAAHPRAKMVEALGNQCPVKDDIVWKVLLKNQDIEIRALSADGKAFAAVSCRARN